MVSILFFLLLINLFWNFITSKACNYYKDEVKTKVCVQKSAGPDIIDRPPVFRATDPAAIVAGLSVNY